MTLKTDDIRPELPGETLRRVDEWLWKKYVDPQCQNLNGITTRGNGGIVCIRFSDGLCERPYGTDCAAYVMPFYATSTDAALGLLEKLGLYYLVGVDGCLEKRFAQVLNYGSGNGWISEEYILFSDLPCAIIRALLRSQNVIEIQI